MYDTVLALLHLAFLVTISLCVDRMVFFQVSFSAMHTPPAAGGRRHARVPPGPLPASMNLRWRRYALLLHYADVKVHQDVGENEFLEVLLDTNSNPLTRAFLTFETLDRVDSLCRFAGSFVDLPLAGNRRPLLELLHQQLDRNPDTENYAVAVLRALMTNGAKVLEHDGTYVGISACLDHLRHAGFYQSV